MKGSCISIPRSPERRFVVIMVVYVSAVECSLQNLYLRSSLGSNASSNHSIIQRIHILFITLPNTNITLIWIPGHRGILRNENIDKAVKAAALLLRLRSQFLSTKADLSLHIRKQVYQHWTVSWQN